MTEQTRLEAHGAEVSTPFYKNNFAYSNLPFWPQTTINVLLNSPKFYPYFSFKHVERILFFILDSLQYVTDSYILTTKQRILYWCCKEKIDVDKIAGAESVKRTISQC